MNFNITGSGLIGSTDFKNVKPLAAFDSEFKQKGHP
jgi:hypothetical protein